MIAACKTCRSMFETTTEDAYHPDGTECPACYQTRNGLPLLTEPDDDDAPDEPTPLVTDIEPELGGES